MIDVSGGKGVVGWSEMGAWLMECLNNSGRDYHSVMVMSCMAIAETAIVGDRRSKNMEIVVFRLQHMMIMTTHEGQDMSPPALKIYVFGV